MGKLEEISKKRNTRQNIQRAILMTIETAGVLTLAAVAPNATQLLKTFGYDPKQRHKEIIKRARENLIHKNFLIYENGFLRLTDKGKSELEKLRLKDWNKEKRKWDGRWRILIYDIPERNRGTRNKIRKTLTYIGFIKVQQSVWLYPYDCEDFITLFKAELKIGKNLIYLIVDSMENDKIFRETFHLPMPVY